LRKAKNRGRKEIPNEEERGCGGLRGEQTPKVFTLYIVKRGDGKSELIGNRHRAEAKLSISEMKEEKERNMIWVKF
jgi:hypothetical protein